jgi:hypothetical protein
MAVAPANNNAIAGDKHKLSADECLAEFSGRSKARDLAAVFGDEGDRGYKMAYRPRAIGLRHPCSG